MQTTLVAVGGELPIFQLCDEGVDRIHRHSAQPPKLYRLQFARRYQSIDQTSAAVETPRRVSYRKQKARLVRSDTRRWIYNRCVHGNTVLPGRYQWVSTLRSGRTRWPGDTCLGSP